MPKKQKILTDTDLRAQLLGDTSHRIQSNKKNTAEKGPT